MASRDRFLQFDQSKIMFEALRASLDKVAFEVMDSLHSEPFHFVLDVEHELAFLPDRSVRVDEVVTAGHHILWVNQCPRSPIMPGLQLFGPFVRPKNFNASEAIFRVVFGVLDPTEFA